jgi:hypothetical protein
MPKPPVGAPRIRTAALGEQAYMNTLVQPAPAWFPVAANAIAFNVVWLITVLGAAGGLAWAGPAALLIFAVAQVSSAARPRYDLAAMGVFATAGLVIDSAWSLSGMVSYAAAWPAAHFAPLWLVTLWAAFSLTIGHSLAWLRPRRKLTRLVGLLGGGFSYWAGARLGAVELAMPAWLYGAAVGLCWAVALPVLIRATAIAARPRLPAHKR